MRRRDRLLLSGLLVLAATGCDQVSKLQAVAHLSDAAGRGDASLLDQIDGFLNHSHPRATGSLEVIPGYFDLVYTENLGSAFSVLPEGPSTFTQPFLIVVAFVLMLGLVGYLFRERAPLSVTGAALVLGGALGNQLDRVRLGYVVDFIHWHLRDAFHWPVFNLADVFIAVGAALLILGQLRRGPLRTRTEGPGGLRASAQPSPSP